MNRIFSKTDKDLCPMVLGPHVDPRDEHADWDGPAVDEFKQWVVVRNERTYASRSIQDRRSVYWYAFGAFRDEKP